MTNWTEVNVYTGRPVDEDAPTNFAGTGSGVDMNPTGMRKKKKKLVDARTKSYKSHRAKLEAARVKREAKRNGVQEEVELDEAILKGRDYEYDEKEGVIKISKKNFAKVKKDSKGTDKSKPTMMALTKQGTALVPVRFTEEVELDEAKKIEIVFEPRTIKNQMPKVVDFFKKNHPKFKLTQNMSDDSLTVDGGGKSLARIGKDIFNNYHIKKVVHEEVDLDEREKSVRQLINPTKEVMIVKKNKVIVIDKKDQDKYMKQGWTLAEETKLEEARWKVKIEGLPPIYMDSSSAGEVKAQLRKLIKKPDMIQDIERVTDAEVNKALRNKISGKEVEEAKLREEVGLDEKIKIEFKTDPKNSNKTMIMKKGKHQGDIIKTNKGYQVMQFNKPAGKIFKSLDDIKPAVRKLYGEAKLIDKPTGEVLKTGSKEKMETEKKRNRDELQVKEWFKLKNIDVKVRELDESTQVYVPLGRRIPNEIREELIKTQYGKMPEDVKNVKDINYGNFMENSITMNNDFWTKVLHDTKGE